MPSSCFLLVREAVADEQVSGPPRWIDLVPPPVFAQVRTQFCCRCTLAVSRAPQVRMRYLSAEISDLFDTFAILFSALGNVFEPCIWRYVQNPWGL